MSCFSFFWPLFVYYILIVLSSLPLAKLPSGRTANQLRIANVTSQCFNCLTSLSVSCWCLSGKIESGRLLLSHLSVQQMNWHSYKCGQSIYNFLKSFKQSSSWVATTLTMSIHWFFSQARGLIKSLIYFVDDLLTWNTKIGQTIKMSSSHTSCVCFIGCTARDMGA